MASQPTLWPQTDGRWLRAALFNLGDCYLMGRGVADDEHWHEAYALFRRGAESGDKRATRAFIALGSML